MGTHPIFESDFDCLTDMNKNDLRPTTSVTKVLTKEKLKRSSKIVPKSTILTRELPDNFTELPDLEELPIMIELNSSVSSASSASSLGSSNFSSGFDSSQPYQFYFGDVSTSEAQKVQTETVLPDLEEIPNSTLPDFNNELHDA